MGVKKKSAALASIRKEAILAGTKFVNSYIADIGSSDGRRIRIRRNTRAECERAVQAWYDERGISGDALAGIPPHKLFDCAAALAQLDAAGVKTSLAVVVSQWLSRKCDMAKSISMKDAFTEYMQHFNKDQHRYIATVQNRVGHFVELHAEKKVCDITPTMCIAFLKQFTTPKTYNNNLRDLRTFFNWCAKKVRRYCTENPIEDLESRQVPYKAPEYMHPPEVRKLFAGALDAPSPLKHRMLMFLALKFFCGMRTCEVGRIALEDIAEDGSSIIVRKPKGHSKGIRPRTFVTEPVFREWFSIIDKSALEGNHKRRNVWDAIVALAKSKGVKIPQNAARHSFISYHRAKYNNPALTTGVCGTSDGMQATNYMSPTFLAEAEEYFGITPASLSPAQES